MSTDTLLSRLDGVRQTGQGRWRARCPAHAGKSASLAIRDGDDGRVLIHCFAGCEALEVLSAAGLTFADVMPERLAYNHGTMRRPFIPADVFDIARQEIAVVAVLASDLHKHKTVSDADYERIFIAVERLDDIAGAAYGH